MKKNKFGMWYQQAKLFFRGNAEAKRDRELRRQAYRDVQVKEYDGAMWLCHRDIPLVKEGSATESLPKLVEQARACWLKYHKEERL